VPTLFKQYAELCDDKRLSFGRVDPDFLTAAWFIFVEIDKMKPEKKTALYRGPIEDK